MGKKSGNGEDNLVRKLAKAEEQKKISMVDLHTIEVRNIEETALLFRSQNPGMPPMFM